MSDRLGIIKVEPRCEEFYIAATEAMFDVKIDRDVFLRVRSVSKHMRGMLNETEEAAARQVLLEILQQWSECLELLAIHRRAFKGCGFFTAPVREAYNRVVQMGNSEEGGQRDE